MAQGSLGLPAQLVLGPGAPRGEWESGRSPSGSRSPGLNLWTRLCAGFMRPRGGGPCGALLRQPQEKLALATETWCVVLQGSGKGTGGGVQGTGVSHPGLVV